MSVSELAFLGTTIFQFRKKLAESLCYARTGLFPSSQIADLEVMVSNLFAGANESAWRVASLEVGESSFSTAFMQFIEDRETREILASRYRKFTQPQLRS